MRKFLVAAATLIATVSMGAQASESYQSVKRIDAAQSYDAKVIADAAPVSWVGAVKVGDVGQTPMYVNHLVGESVYSAERLVRNAIASGECTLGSQVPGLAQGVSCAIVLPGKVLTVALVGTAGIIDEIIVDVIIGVPTAILNLTAGIMEQLANAMHGVLGVPFVVVSGVVTAAGEFLQAVGYVVQTGVTAVVDVVSFIVRIPCKLISALPPSPCDGVGKDKLCGGKSGPSSHL